MTNLISKQILYMNSAFLYDNIYALVRNELHYKRRDYPLSINSSIDGLIEGYWKSLRSVLRDGKFED